MEIFLVPTRWSLGVELLIHGNRGLVVCTKNLLTGLDLIIRFDHAISFRVTMIWLILYFRWTSKVSFLSVNVSSQTFVLKDEFLKVPAMKFLSKSNKHTLHSIKFNDAIGSLIKRTDT